MASFASLTSLVFLLSSLLFASHLSVIRAQTVPPLVKGLSWNFHSTDCPKLEKVIRDKLTKALKKDIGLAAGLLRIHFHDCFVQGCDGSVLLDGSASGPGEQNAPPNLSLRPAAFKIINELRKSVDKACGRQVVSCSDITALAARDAVFLSGGPEYQVPLGRRDGLNFATRQETLNNLPPFFFTARQLIDFVANKGLDATDLVAISGGHTIGIGHCTSFTERLYPNQDSTMDQTFAKNLKRVCPTVNSTGTTVLDIRSPDSFDNKYYVDLMNRQGLFTSDQDLYTDKATREIVKSFAVNQTLFFERFAFSMAKMSQMNVLTGKQGEIRANCSRRNAASTAYLATVVDDQGENAAF